MIKQLLMLTLKATESRRQIPEKNQKMFRSSYIVGSLCLILLNLCCLQIHYDVFSFGDIDESICNFRSVRSILSIFFYFVMENLSANSIDLVQTPPYVASDLGLHCLTLLRISR